MKYFSLVIVLLLLSCKANNNTVQNPCSIDYLHTLKNADTLNDREIYLFLEYCNTTDCDNNAEYSEVSNEMLFFILEKYTGQFISQLDKISDQAKILDELASPVHDGIDITSILDKAEAYNKYPETKQEVIVTLNTAIQKYN